MAEVRQRLTWAELLEWDAYRRVVIDEKRRALKDKKQVIEW